MSTEIDQGKPSESRTNEDVAPVTKLEKEPITFKLDESVERTSNAKDEHSSDAKTGNTTAATSNNNVAPHLSPKSADRMKSPRRKRSITLPSDVRILVVDDDALTLRIAQRLLTKLGYDKIVLVDSGKKALDVLRNSNEKFHLVLSDIHMPEMDGFQLIHEVKKMQDDIAIFMMSGTENLDIVYKCLKLGADHYILKPIKEDQLKNLWQTLYRKRQEIRVLGQLDNEKVKTISLQEKTVKLETEISELKKAIDEAVETPIRIISQEVESLLSRTDLPAEVTLSTILKKLRKVDIYQPAFKKLLSDTTDIEPMTRRWLMHELGGPDPILESNLPVDFSTGWQEESSKSQEALRSWDFDVWAYKEEQLFPIIADMFNDFGLFERFNVPKDKFQNFLNECRNNYVRKNPYHNFRHAFDVTQTVYLLLTSGGAAAYLSYLEIFAVLIGAVIHDIGHPGLNNNFQIATGSSLSLRYNDRSILENHHCSLGFSLLKKPENDIFSGLTDEQRKEVRNLIIMSVLATDLAHHMEITAQWNSALNKFSKDEKAHRILLLQILLKAADISNPGKPFEIAKYWANMVQEEFFAQGDIEKEKGLPVSPFMDREKPALPKMQINFIDYLVAPLFGSLKEVLPAVMVITDRLDENRKMWKSILESDEPSAS
jgi:response regulator RpfG family c-di-GMP phosphodiesterase